MRWFLATVAVCLVVVGTAFGGGGPPSTRHVTKAQLARMVLPRSALGAAWTRFPDKHPAGFYTNARYAAGSIDPRMTAASLAKDGRLTGYVLGFSLRRSKFEDALSHGSGALNIVTGVGLYSDKAGPAAGMARGMRDLRALVGKRVRDGAILERGAAFRLPRIGDAADGIRFEISIKGLHIYYTEVAFQYGRLLAEVSEARADPQNVDTALIAVSRALEGRITRVLTGKIRGTDALGS